MTRPLDVPPETAGNPHATEMIRVWLAHKDVHLSLLLGMWQDAEDAGVDERDAWGQLLADVAAHIAGGLNQSQGFAEADTLRCMRESFIVGLDASDKQRTGGYADS
jgi:hypothetical protein